MRIAGRARRNGIIVFVACAALFALWQMAFGCARQGVRASVGIDAESDAYRIEWNGETGTLVRRADGPQAEQRLPLTLIHCDRGPKDDSKYLVWFLARNTNDFALLWCYLDASGDFFWCWMYQYPGARVTTVPFSGSYKFAPPKEPLPPAPAAALTLVAPPPYNGHDFHFGDWTRQAGTLGSLPVIQAVSRFGKVPAATPSVEPITYLSGLQVSPLYELDVGAENGWRANGWSELHALAYDAAHDPYYLICYTNSTSGYAVDLKRGIAYFANFNQTAQFDRNPPASAAAPNGPPEPPIARFDRFELALTSKQTHANPYKDVTLLVDFLTPDGTHQIVPGFWDGGGTWKARLAPSTVGAWHWSAQSNDPDLNGKEGDFECVSDGGVNTGFLIVHPAARRFRFFAMKNDTTFYPALVSDPLFLRAFSASGSSDSPGSSAPATGATGSSEHSPAASDAAPPAFLAFQRRIDSCAALGFNRLLGNYLFGADSKSVSDEGGAPFVKGSLDTLNPAFFAWLDKRIAYCNAKGVVPDLGIGCAQDALQQDNYRQQIGRAWRYIVARYGAYDVCWNLFPTDNQYAVEFAALTRRNDPARHPLTTVMSVGAAQAALPSGIATVSTDPAGAAKSVYSWLDVVTIAGVVAPISVVQSAAGVLAPLTVVLSEGEEAKPMAFFDAESGAVVPDTKQAQAKLRRLWEIRMRDGYWACEAPPTDGPGDWSLPEIRWTTNCARLFRRTRYQRLEPYPELLGGPPGKAGSPQAGNSGPDMQPPAANADSPGTAPLVLADPGWEYVLYITQGASVTLDLLEATGRLRVTWFDPETGRSQPTETPVGGAYVSFTPPDQRDWVFISRR